MKDPMEKYRIPKEVTYKILSEQRILSVSNRIKRMQKELKELKMYLAKLTNKIDSSREIIGTKQFAPQESFEQQVDKALGYGCLKTTKLGPTPMTKEDFNQQVEDALIKGSTQSAMKEIEKIKAEFLGETKHIRTRIISSFPGTGKSYYHKKYPATTLDSDSSQFSWVETTEGKVRNPDFPINYIKHIKENIGKYEFIFVSSHKEVRDALLDNCLFFYLVYPDIVRKENFIQRFRDRGSPESFIQQVSDNWEKWIRECEFCETGCNQVRMTLPNLENELRHIVASEGGDS